MAPGLPISPGGNRSGPAGPPSPSCHLTHTPPATPAALSSFLPGTMDGVVSVGLLSGGESPQLSRLHHLPLCSGASHSLGLLALHRGSPDPGATAERCVTVGG